MYPQDSRVTAVITKLAELFPNHMVMTYQNAAPWPHVAVKDNPHCYHLAQFSFTAYIIDCETHDIPALHPILQVDSTVSGVMFVTMDSPTDTHITVKVRPFDLKA